MRVDAAIARFKMVETLAGRSCFDMESVLVASSVFHKAFRMMSIKVEANESNREKINNRSRVFLVSISSNNIENHLILCSAASLSNFIIHQCYDENPNNTFLDIGSSLNPYLKLEGWKFTRGYLTSYWMKSKSHWGVQVDEW